MSDPAKPAPETGKKKRKNKTRELVECLLVAGLLALGIRSFALQIFKIPTRSMEPTLIGNEDYGDRVVAAMWYRRAGFPHLTLARPDRWQVIVFNHYTVDKKGREVPTNFIKRLVGLPGERVEIRDGDIWIQPPGGAKPAEIQAKPPGVQEQLWTKLCDLDFAEWWRLPAYWRAEGWDQEKRALGPGGSLHWVDRRRLDNRFIRPTVREVECPKADCPGRVRDPEHPKDPPRPFRFPGAFDTARPVVFCPKCHAEVVGVYGDGSPKALALVPAEGRPNDYWAEGENAPSVPDLRLTLDFELREGAGDLVVILQGRSEPYRLTLPLGRPGAATLTANRIGPPEEKALPVTPGVPHHLEVVNVDGRFWAELDGVVIGPRPYTPNPTPGYSDVSLQLTGTAGLTLRNIRLYRDIYYGFSGTTMTPFDPATNDPVARDYDLNGKLKVSTRTSFIRLLDDGYFFLGDNQLASADSREFREMKRDRDIVARGIFVTWPPSRLHLVW